jgi:hypothetical protein
MPLAHLEHVRRSQPRLAVGTVDRITIVSCDLIATSEARLHVAHTVLKHRVHGNVITRKHVNYILDADVRSFFDKDSQGRLVGFVEPAAEPHPVASLCVPTLSIVSGSVTTHPSAAV